MTQISYFQRISSIFFFFSFSFDVCFFFYFLFDYFYNHNLVEKIFLIEILLLMILDCFYELTQEFIFMTFSILFSIAIFFFTLQDAFFYNFDFYHFFIIFFTVFLVFNYSTLIVVSRQEQINTQEEPYAMV